MKREPPLPHELWGQLSPAVQAALGLIVEGYEQRIASLETEVAELKAPRGQNSQNSARPPSSAGPHVKRKPPKLLRAGSTARTRAIRGIGGPGSRGRR